MNRIHNNQPCIYNRLCKTDISTKCMEIHMFPCNKSM